jgi:hypothetical protein
MDIVQQCLDLVPSPDLSPTFALFKSIYSTIDQVQATYQLRVLAECISQLLIALNTEYEPGQRPLTPTIAAALNDLSEYVIAFDDL